MVTEVAELWKNHFQRLYSYVGVVTGDKYIFSDRMKVAERQSVTPLEVKGNALVTLLKYGRARRW